MPIKYKPVKVSDNINRAAAPRYMPRCTDCVPVTLREIAQRISDSSSFTTADVVGMMERLLHDIPDYLSKGFSVHLGDFGIFTTSLRGESRAKPEQVNRYCIQEVKVNFKPGKEFRNALQGADFILAKSTGKSPKDE